MVSPSEQSDFAKGDKAGQGYHAVPLIGIFAPPFTRYSGYPAGDHRAAIVLSTEKLSPLSWMVYSL